MDQTDRYDPDAFDFLGPPFAVPVRGDLLLTIPQEDALSGALNAIGRGVGLVLIAGEAGSGRTLVADALADSLQARDMTVDQIAQLGGPGGGALLARVAPLLGIEPGRLAPALAALVAATRDGGPDVAPETREAAARGLAAGQAGAGFGTVHAATGVIDRDRPGRVADGRRLAAEAWPARALAVVVDDAGTWPDEDLLLLVSLAGLRVGDSPLLRAVLIGDAALAQRVAMLRGAAAGTTGAAGTGQDGSDAVSLRIPPLTLRQGEEYLAHRIAAAGGSLQRTMSPGAIEEILQRCGGNPGRIDRLADDCLAITARRRRRTVTATVVRTARQAPRPRRRLSVPVAYALLGVAGGAIAAGTGVALALHGWSQPGSGAGDVPDRGDPALFAGAGRFGAPDPATLPPAPAPRVLPRPYVPDYPAQGFARAVPRSASPPARLALAPAPVAPLLPGVGMPSWPAVPPLPVAVPSTIRTPGLAVVAGAALPVLPSEPALLPAQGLAAEAELPPAPAASAIVVPPLRAGSAPTRDAAPAPGPAPSRATTATPLPVPPDPPVRLPAVAVPPPAPVRPAPSGPRDGLVVTHVARGHDTTATLLRRIWGADDPTARALFRSLNPGIDAQGPWPSGTVVAVPQRLRGQRSSAPTVLPEPPPRVAEAPRAREFQAPRSREEAVRDNPAGQQRSGVPYFCRSILPQNGAEDAYTRQVCGR
ncbi:MAG: hypothetical protein ACRYG6_03000 [Janthinobacterium lividum]